MLEFLKIQEDDLELILRWRTHPEVTRYMFTDIEYNLEKQKKWYSKISNDEFSRWWMIVYEGKRIGVAGLTDIDYRNNRCSWGYYIGDLAYWLVGGIIPPYLYNYVFKIMNFNKIMAHVMDGNHNIMKIHEAHGYRLVGKYRDHIYKNNKYHDVYVYELLADTWSSTNKYEQLIAKFE